MLFDAFPIIISKRVVFFHPLLIIVGEVVVGKEACSQSGKTTFAENCQAFLDPT
jgi:hypothetical protein